MGLFSHISHAASGLAHHATHSFGHLTHGVGGGIVSSHFGGFGGLTRSFGGLKHTFGGIGGFIKHNPVSSTVGNVFHSGNQLIRGAGNLGQGLGNLFKSPLFLYGAIGLGAYVVLKR